MASAARSSASRLTAAIAWGARSPSVTHELRGVFAVARVDLALNKFIQLLGQQQIAQRTLFLHLLRELAMRTGSAL